MYPCTYTFHKPVPTRPKFVANGDMDGVEITHHFGQDGSRVYIKETMIQKGRALDMHIHTFTHKSVLCSGRVRLTVDGKTSTVKAPAVLTVHRGIAHRVEALADSVWLCIHASEVTDPDMIDHTLVGD